MQFGNEPRAISAPLWRRANHVDPTNERSVLFIFKLLIVQLLNRPAAALRPNDNVALLSKSLKDRLNLNEDGITHVDPNEQDAILEIVAKNCTDRILNSTYSKTARGSSPRVSYG